MNARILITCEHAGNRVPAEYIPLFQNASEVLTSHRGWDLGALTLARTFQQRLSAPMFYTPITRLLVETNRSVTHRHLFSEFTGPLDPAIKQRILDLYYYPHRRRIESWVATQLDRRRTVIHVSIHTFTPRLNGETRTADVALLYDPKRSRERAFCARWLAALRQQRPDLRMRRNYPYLGSADGLTTYLRRTFGERYYGIELEVNQAWPGRSGADWRRLRLELADSLDRLCVACMASAD